MQQVVVTAGGSGIGRAIAEGFLQSGARVHIADIDAAAIAAMCKDNPTVSSSMADVSDQEQVRHLFAQARAHLTGIDVLVNCAGIGGPAALVEDLSYENWRRCLAVNLDGTFLCTRAVATQMKAKGSGSIINIASTAGLYGYPLRSAYASAKWAIIGFTKSMAMEMGPSGVRVNAICPGSVNGPRMDTVIANEAKAKGIAAAAIRQRYAKTCSLRTFIDAEDIANMAVFLASPAGKRITGQAISVDEHIETPGGLDE